MFINIRKIRKTSIEKIEHLYKITGNKCFVAMWFDPSLENAFKNGFKKAIRESGYKPLRIDKKEYNESIYAEIVTEIRQSKLVVADFTGNREGVYFEAGFAHGLGIPVIYTCRKDWTHEEVLRDKNGVEIDFIIEKDGEVFLVEAKHSERPNPGKLNFNKIAPLFKQEVNLMVACGVEHKGLISLKDFSISNPLFGSII